MAVWWVIGLVSHEWRKPSQASHSLTHSHLFTFRVWFWILVSCFGLPWPSCQNKIGKKLKNRIKYITVTIPHKHHRFGFWTWVEWSLEFGGSGSELWLFCTDWRLDQEQCHELNFVMSTSGLGWRLKWWWEMDSRKVHLVLYALWAEKWQQSQSQRASKIRDGEEDDDEITTIKSLRYVTFCPLQVMTWWIITIKLFWIWEQQQTKRKAKKLDEEGEEWDKCKM